MPAGHPVHDLTSENCSGHCFIPAVIPRSALAAVLACLLTSVIEVQAVEKFEPTWESLDRRPTPRWWWDAKFGIFIHWGPYSVPAFSKVGTYSEWYWMTLTNPDSAGHKETRAFHDRVYGKNFTYPDFVPFFKCELFDPAHWAKLFKSSGAKYVVLTSKHHDGYTLWPSKEAQQSWGRPWSATNSGPCRDLLGELANEVRKTDVKMGIYYSFYEWFNPLYVADPSLYVDRHMIPQFKDVVSRYKPAVIFADGEWDHSDATWKSPELVAWLYNDSPCREEVVVNDRWGKETRHKHGGYYTTEYGAGLPNADHSWEESRGMAHSYGYNRAENSQDYTSAHELIYMLVDIVSRGGNFLLDIGPTADGRIPVIMQERLLEIGDWLRVNGEAIYGTITWKRSCQWSKGKRPAAEYGTFNVKYDVLKLTVDPDPGTATKEVFFTSKVDKLYCICPQYPDRELVVKDVKAARRAKITLLGHDQELDWRQTDDDLVIVPPKLNPSKLPCSHAYVFRISAFED